MSLDITVPAGMQAYPSGYGGQVRGLSPPFTRSYKALLVALVNGTRTHNQEQ
jgi:hypothetical protein